MINGNTYDKDIRKWIEKAKATRNMALTNFAYGIEKRLGGSTGSSLMSPSVTDYWRGPVNKIKAVKRQMFNKAGIKLLRAKILHS